MGMMGPAGFNPMMMMPGMNPQMAAQMMPNPMGGMGGMGANPVRYLYLRCRCR